MPPVIAAIAAYVAAYAYVIAVVAVVASAGMVVYGTAQARRAERDAKNAALASMKDRMVTRIATESPHRYIYGRAKVGADIVAMFTSGDRDQFKHLVCVHAAHECDAIEEVWVNNAIVDGLDNNGDPTVGRFATDPSYEIGEQLVTGPTFTLAQDPRPGSVWVFSGTGSNMAQVPVTGVNGRTVTVAQSGQLFVSYEYYLSYRFDDPLPGPAGSKTPVVRVQRHLGGPNDPADAYLRSQVGEKWPATAVLRGLCYTVITLDLNHPEFQSGLVPIHAVIRGKKLYDPRDGITRWSQNPALIIRDYLTGPLCGVPAADLPTAQFITAANVCDEASPTGGVRYTINGTVTSDQGQASVLESMTQAMAGGLVATTWDVYAGKYVAPVAALLQSDIVGSLSVTPGVSDASVYNGVKGQYIGPENKYVQTDFKPYQNSVYRESDGRDLYTNLDFPFTESLQRVTNLARVFTEDQRNGFTIRAEFSLKAWPLKVGQRITFTSAVLGHNAKVFRITDKSYSPTSAMQLSLKEDDASIWDYADATVVDSTPNSDLPDPWKIDAPASLSCTSGEAALLRQADGTTVPRIMASWPAMTQSNGVQVEVEWRAVSSSTWERTTVSGSEVQAYLSPITPGYFYIVRARTVNPSLNVRSGWIATVYQVEVFTATPTVYMWAANKPATPAGAASYAWPTGTFGAAPAGWSLTIPTAPTGGNVILWAAVVAVSDVSDVASSFNWSQAEVRNQGYAPSAAGQGPAGYSNARVFAYQRKATAPTGTPGSVDYDFTTGAITTATLLNGWQKTIPASDGNPLYVTSASASAAGTTDTIATGEWSGAVVLAYDGGAGTPGINTASVSIYQRNNTGTTPALPSLAATYTFSPAGLSGLNNGWATTVPAASAGKYLFVSTATAFGTSATDSIAANEWAAAQILAQDGATGTAGVNNAVVYAYQRSSTAPTGTPGAVSYDFPSATITTATLANGWQKTIPAANGNPLYVTAVTASAAGTTDAIGSTEWSGAVIMASDGGAGAPGLNSATVTLYQRTASATSPAKPSAAATYTFATGAITGLNNGWNTFIPTTGGAYLHTTFATAIAATASDTIAATEWATVQLMYDAADLIAAKAAADAANTAITDMARDDLLSPAEKSAENLRWNAIVGERPGIDSAAAALGITTERTAYTNAYNTLNAYITGFGAAFTTIPGAAITIVGATYRANFKAYYDAKQTLLNAVSAVSATTADANKITGMNYFRVLTQGNARTAAMPAGTHGFYKNGVLAYTAGLSYMLVVIRRSDAAVVWTRTYNVAVDSAAAAALVTDLNNAGPHEIVVVYTFDEPQTNRFNSGLAAAMYRCGASRSIFGSSEFRFQSAYCLIGIPGCGEGNGAEFYQGDVNFDTKAWIDVAFTVVNGNYTAMAGYTPRSLKDYGFSGDMNATVGAPAGSLVAGVDASTVVANATGAATAILSDFTASLSGTVGGSFPNGSSGYGTISVNIAGGNSPYTVRWLLVEEALTGLAGTMSLSTKTGTSTTVSGSGQNASLRYELTCIVTDAKQRSITTGRNIFSNHGTPP